MYGEWRRGSLDSFGFFFFPFHAGAPNQKLEHALFPFILPPSLHITESWMFFSLKGDAKHKHALFSPLTVYIIYSFTSSAINVFYIKEGSLSFASKQVCVTLLVWRAGLTNCILYYKLPDRKGFCDVLSWNCSLECSQICILLVAKKTHQKCYKICCWTDLSVRLRT